ncbi:unnamed protein product [Lampetra fluviatilis]
MPVKRRPHGLRVLSTSISRAFLFLAGNDSSSSSSSGGDGGGCLVTEVYRHPRSHRRDAPLVEDSHPSTVSSPSSSSSQAEAAAAEKQQRKHWQQVWLWPVTASPNPGSFTGRNTASCAFSSIIVIFAGSGSIIV